MHKFRYKFTILNFLTYANLHIIEKSKNKLFKIKKSNHVFTSSIEIDFLMY
jgi:hypothetical protein